ncbi:MAG: hypothetical protein GY854_08675 [Deltaproteobacteria bacterium]|nr:hypothetical protein [Deltaproteobacteria bacterium]
MQIKCPKCSAVYEVPEKALPKEQRGDKPQKMRCFKCKSVFNVSLRPAKPPETPPPEPKPPEPKPPEPKTPKSEEKLKPPLAPKENPPPPPPLSPPSITPGEEELCISVFDYDEKKKNEAAVSTPSTDNKRPSIPDVVSDTDAWTTGKTLDLSGYSTKGQMTIRRYFLSCLAVGLALIVLLLVFVAARNDWVLSFPNLSEQIGIAFFGESARQPPDSVKELAVTVKEGFKILSKDKVPILVVSGEVINPGEQTRVHVVLEGRIIDSQGKIRFTEQAPCGRVFKTKRLKKMNTGSFDKLYLKKGKPYNCRVKGNASRKYLLIFDDMPPDFDEKYRVEVKAVSGDVKESTDGR